MARRRYRGAIPRHLVPLLEFWRKSGVSLRDCAARCRAHAHGFEDVSVDQIRTLEKNKFGSVQKAGNAPPLLGVPSEGMRQGKELPLSN